MSPFSKTTSPWLKNAEAAALIGVNARIVRRWMTCQDTRDALSAVRHGKQWRIPYPVNLDQWQGDTRRRLKKLRVHLEPDWKRELRKIALKETNPLFIEPYRLWLAAYIKALGRGRIIQTVRDGIDILRRISLELLRDLPESKRIVENLRSKIPAKIRARGLSVRSLMRYWPKEQHFDLIRSANMPEEFENIRRRLDFTQAARDLRRRGENLMAKSLRPRHHENNLVHMNDTWEILIGRIVKNPTPEELKKIVLASAVSQTHGKKLETISIDFRQPQIGLALSEFRKRHPMKKSPQREIKAAVLGILDSNPCVEDRPYTGKKPGRGGDY